MRYRRLRIAGGTYFFTLVTHQRRKLFADASAVALYYEAVKVVKARHPFELVAEVVLPDHLHAIWEMPESDANFSLRWRMIKTQFTRRYGQAYDLPDVDASRKRRGEQALWQRRFWEHWVHSEPDFGRLVEYIHLNPVHHGYVSAPKLWPHSTFADWVGRGLYEEDWGSQEPMRLPHWASRHE